MKIVSISTRNISSKDGMKNNDVGIMIVKNSQKVLPIEVWTKNVCDTMTQMNELYEARGIQ